MRFRILMLGAVVVSTSMSSVAGAFHTPELQQALDEYQNVTRNICTGITPQMDEAYAKVIAAWEAHRAPHVAMGHPDSPVTTGQVYLTPAGQVAPNPSSGGSAAVELPYLLGKEGGKQGQAPGLGRFKHGDKSVDWVEGTPENLSNWAMPSSPSRLTSTCSPR